MRTLFILTILTFILAGCQMRYGYIPRVHSSTQKEKPLVKHVRKGPSLTLRTARMNNKGPVIPDLPDAPGILPYDSTFSLEPVRQLIPDIVRKHLPENKFTIDSPFHFEGDSAIRMSEDEIYLKRRRNTLKGVFLLATVGSNAAFIATGSAFGIILLGVVSVIMLLVLIGKDTEYNSRRYPEHYDEKRVNRSFSTTIIVGISMVFFGLLLLLVGFLLWIDIAVIFGILLVFGSIIPLIVGLIQYSAYNKRLSANQSSEMTGKSGSAVMSAGSVVLILLIFLVLLLLISWI